MNGVIFYSNTRQSRRIAEYFSRVSGFSLFDLNKPEDAASVRATEFERAFLVFPVYCQNVPSVVEDCLAGLRAQRLAVVATYGRMCYGNVLYEIQRHYAAGKIVAAAYVPTKHSYLEETEFSDFEALRVVAEKMREDQPLGIEIPRAYKNPFADFAREWRSRRGVKIVRGDECTRCGKCERECLYRGIVSGKTNGRCIRCLKCVTECPVGALRFYNRLPLRVYLRKKKINDLVIYV